MDKQVGESYRIATRQHNALQKKIGSIRIRLSNLGEEISSIEMQSLSRITEELRAEQISQIQHVHRETHLESHRTITNDEPKAELLDNDFVLRRRKQLEDLLHSVGEFLLNVISFDEPEARCQ